MSKTSIFNKLVFDYSTKYYSYNIMVFFGRKYNNPCETCMNNPQNNPYASGVCNCALPALLNPIF